MSKNRLHSILVRDKEFAGLMQQIATATGAQVWVEDTHGSLLFGVRHDHPLHRIPVSVFGELLGNVSGDEKAPLIATWLSQWATQEEGRKKLGAEVLHMYREINLMFDFSEKLALISGIESIAQLALSEAGRLIYFDRGGVLFQPDPSDPIRVLAQSGDLPDLTERLRQIPAIESSAIIDLGGTWGLFAPLKVNYRKLGSILLLRSAGKEFSAEDLKLLTSLALQSASAIESSIQYEAATARALEQQREQLIIDLALRNPFFRKVVAAIEHHLSDSGFGVEQLSQIMHLSPSQLQRKILALTEKTPGQIIRDLRMRKAKGLLLNTDLTVAEIAFQCGFLDPSYFTRIFRKEAGIPPSQWKEDQNSV